MSAPVPGWYTDPAGTGEERWWDGTRWTGNVRPVARATPPAPSPLADPTAPPAAPRSARPTGPATPATPVTPPTYDGPPDPFPPQQPSGYTFPGQQPPGQYPTHGYGGYGQPTPRPPASFAQRNGYSIATVVVIVVYAALAIAVHFVLVGILPILFAVRAFGRREPLRVAAAVLAGLSLVFTIFEFVHR